MTTHVFAPQLKREGREREGKKEQHFLVHCYPEEQLRTHQRSFSLLFSSPHFIPSGRVFFFSFASRAVLSAISHYLVSV